MIDAPYWRDPRFVGIRGPIARAVRYHAAKLAADQRVLARTWRIFFEGRR